MTTPTPTPSHTARMFALAARAASRAVGRVEPNPLVGCVLEKDGVVLSIGHHRHFGGIHAEVDALRACTAAGHDPRGATMYVTLEPCNHTGKQPPCTEAILAAGIARVVIARADPNPIAAGGADRLRAAGVPVEFTDQSPPARELSEPFIARLRTGRPWTIAKWAQTLDGRIATRTGESQWISCEASRRRVHALRARCDAILTGIGTVAADNPMLNARLSRGKPRRTALRVVADTNLEIQPHSKLLVTARQFPTLIACAESLASAALPALVQKRRQIEKAGARLVGVREQLVNGRLGIDLSHLLVLLAREHGIATTMIEAGPGLLGSLLADDLIDEAVVYVAPMVLGDELARAAAVGRAAPALTDGRRFRLLRVKRVSDDLELVYRRQRPGPAQP